VVEVAVAGFAESEINVELADNVLTVTGEKVRDLTTPSIQNTYIKASVTAISFAILR
jgi:HSP20 family molecular chaperone IbpA